MADREATVDALAVEASESAISASGVEGEGGGSIAWSAIGAGGTLVGASEADSMVSLKGHPRDRDWATNHDPQGNR